MKEKGFKFKKIKVNFRTGETLVYKCFSGIICKGYVEVYPNGKYIISKKEDLIEKIKEAFEKQEGG